MEPLLTKTCSKCGKKLPATIEFFLVQKTGKYGFRSICKNCNRESLKLTKVKKPELYKEIKRRAYAKRKLLNPEKERNRFIKYSELLGDSYVSKRIKRQYPELSENITPEMILLKRTEIKCKRLIKNHKKLQDETC